MNRYIKQYIKAVKRAFPVVGSAERSYLSGIAQTIQDYFGEQEPLDEAQIIEAFGDPRTIALDYLHQLEPEVLEQRIRRDRPVKIVQVCGLLAFGLLVMPVVIYYGNALMLFVASQLMETPVYEVTAPFWG